MSNMECGLKSQCVLMSSMNSISYGTIPCSKCPTHNVVCMVPTTGLPARCSCLMEQSVSFDICVDSSGFVTNTNPNKLCGYTPKATSSSTTWVWDFQDIMIVPCIQTLKAVCTNVYKNGYHTLMPVATSIRVSNTASRRLLTLEDQIIPESGPHFHTFESEYELMDTEALHQLLMLEDWNITAAPCSSLAMAYQAQSKLSILERHVLHECAFWRFVGRRVLQRANLTHLVTHETFLVSIDDLSTALAQKDNLAIFLRNPQIFGTALLYHPWLKPLRAIACVLANIIEEFAWIHKTKDDIMDFVLGDLDLNPEREEVNQNQTTNLDELRQQRVREVEEMFRNITFAPSLDKLFEYNPHLRSRYNNTLNRARIQNKTSVRVYKPKKDLNVSKTKPHARKLTGMSVSAAEKELLKVQVYSANIASGQNQAPNQVIVQQSWLRGTGTWPPTYDFSFQSCPAAVVTLDITLKTVGMLTTYYTNFDSPQRPVDRSFRQALPRISFIYNNTKYNVKTWSSWIFHNTFSLVNVNPAEFFTASQTTPWSLRWILGTTIHCDLPSVLSCSNHIRDLVMSTIVFCFFYILFSIITNSLGFPVLSTLFFLSYPLFILWYVYGMAPTCFPLVPTCLIQDIIVAANAILPSQIWLPKKLLCHPEQYNQTFNQTCLRPCDELNFTTWADPVAFTLCNVDAEFCLMLTNMSTGSTQADEIISPFLAPLKSTILEKYAIVKTGEDMDAYKTCAWVTGVLSLPFFAITLAIIMFATSALVAAVQIIPVLVSLLAQAAAYQSVRHD